MSDAWPSFADPIPCDAGTWTASLDSYDQYHEVYYYRVTLNHRLRGEVRLMASVDVHAGWSDTEERDEIRYALGIVAASAQSNTPYRGALGQPRWGDDP
jgi:hypothetical protein